MDILKNKDLGNFLKKFSPLNSEDPGWDAFYRRFEDRFRGNERLIGERLRTRYQGKMKALVASSNSFTQGIFVDLGCGRGEFLDLAKALGFATLGIDASGEMVSASAKKGHNAQVGDLLSFLTHQTASESLVMITLMHVVEHVNAKYNWRVFNQAYRALKKGGVLLVETPSLYSLWASQRQFFLDPTHEKPVHPELLQFMAEDAGFSKVDLLEFDPVEDKRTANLSQLGGELKKLEAWLYGPMDIAVWAVK